MAFGSRWPNDQTWRDVLRFRESPLFVSTIAHFFVRAFRDDGVDEFLAHITAIEAAFGLRNDHNRRKRPPVAGKDVGATARVASRLAAAIGSDAASADFRRLFDLRSQFLHGGTMGPFRVQIANWPGVWRGKASPSSCARH
jgi:hypothetical protein